MRTVDQIIADLAIHAHEQDGLAWMPEPPREREPGSDCRIGGSCGLNFNAESRHAQWARARFRMQRRAR